MLKPPACNLAPCTLAHNHPGEPKRPRLLQLRQAKLPIRQLRQPGDSRGRRRARPQDGRRSSSSGDDGSGRRGPRDPQNARTAYGTVPDQGEINRRSGATETAVPNTGGPGACKGTLENGHQRSVTGNNSQNEPGTSDRRCAERDGTRNLARLVSRLSRRRFRGVVRMAVGSELPSEVVRTGVITFRPHG